MRYVHDRAVAEDVTQETWIALWERIDTFRGPAVAREMEWDLPAADRGGKAPQHQRIDVVGTEAAGERDGTSHLAEIRPAAVTDPEVVVEAPPCWVGQHRKDRHEQCGARASRMALQL